MKVLDESEETNMRIKENNPKDSNGIFPIALPAFHRKFPSSYYEKPVNK